MCGGCADSLSRLVRYDARLAASAASRVGRWRISHLGLSDVILVYNDSANH